MIFKQKEFEQLVDFRKKYSGAHAKSELDVGKKTPLTFPFKPDTVSKKQRATMFSIHLQDKVNTLLDILVRYENLSPVNKEKKLMGKFLSTPSLKANH